MQADAAARVGVAIFPSPKIVLKGRAMQLVVIVESGAGVLELNLGVEDDVVGDRVRIFLTTIEPRGRPFTKPGAYKNPYQAAVLLPGGAAVTIDTACRPSSDR